MVNSFIMDTYGWIEYFRGTKQGLTVKKIVDEKKNKIITIDSSLAEIKLHCLRTGYDFNYAMNLIKANSIIFPVMIDTWLRASAIKFEMMKKRQDFGLMDAILLAKQYEIGSKLVTGDPHFKGLKNIIFLED